MSFETGGRLGHASGVNSATLYTVPAGASYSEVWVVTTDISSPVSVDAFDLRLLTGAGSGNADYISFTAPLLDPHGTWFAGPFRIGPNYKVVVNDIGSTSSCWNVFGREVYQSGVTDRLESEELPSRLTAIEQQTLLAQATSTASSVSTIYTPAAGNTSVRDAKITYANVGTGVTLVGLSISPVGGFTDANTFLYTQTLEPGDYGMVSDLQLGQNEELEVFSDTNNVAVNLFGTLTTATNCLPRHLGGVEPAGTSETVLYTSPVGCRFVKNIFVWISDRASSPVPTYRLTVSDNGVATSNDDYLVRDYAMGAGQTTKIGPIFLGANQDIRVKQSAGNAMTFNAFGIEVYP